MKRLFVAVLAFTLMGTASACTDTTGPGGALAGTYSLRTVNGAQLPVTLCSTGFCYDVLSAEITLDANGNYQEISRYSDGNDSSTGYWTLSGSQLTLTDDGSGTATYATVSGNSLIFPNLFTGSSTISAVYTR